MVTRKFLPLFALLSVAVLLLDQVSKYLLKTYLPHWKIGFLTISYTTNTGAAFSLLQQQTPWLALVSLIVAGGIIFFYDKIPQEKIPQILFGVFLGGVLGNLLDRLFSGYVVDFIDLSSWPSFNIADSAITLAAIGLVIYYWNE